MTYKLWLIDLHAPLSLSSAGRVGNCKLVPKNFSGRGYFSFGKLRAEFDEGKPLSPGIVFGRVLAAVLAQLASHY